MEITKRIAIGFICMCLGAAAAFTYAARRDAVLYNWQMEMNLHNLAESQECTRQLNATSAQLAAAQSQLLYYRQAAAKGGQPDPNAAIIAIARELLK